MKDDRQFLSIMLIADIFLFFLVSLGIHPSGGADAISYLAAYYDINPGATFFRVILSSQIVGVLSGLSPTLFHVSLLLLHLVYLISAYYAATILGVLAARIVTVLIVLHFQVNVLFHQLASDNLSALGVACFAALAVRWYTRNLLSTHLLLGCAAFLLVLIRPSNLPFILFGLMPVLCHGFNRRNLQYALAFFAVFATGMIGYSSYNYTRHGIFGVAAGKDLIPGFFLFTTGKFHPQNGPASARLFELIDRELMNKPPYVDLGMNAETFFARHGRNMFNDMLLIDSYYAPGTVRSASLETIQHHFLELTGAWLKRLYFILNHYHSLELNPRTEQTPPVMSPSNLSFPPGDHADVPIGFNSMPEGLRLFDELERDQKKRWQQRHPNPAHLPSYEQLVQSYPHFLRSGTGHYTASLLISHFMITIVPPMGFFLLAGLGLVTQCHRKEVRLILLLLFPALTVIMISSSLYPTATYRMPFDLLIVMAGVAGIMGSSFMKKLFFSAP
ncbi:MAG: hypothetical protein HQL76_15070 [Magnetococcales bacterium]|nr:hypothetical protein [Magnetococcales bacterium]